jgi:hypothetical protein
LNWKLRAISCSLMLLSVPCGPGLTFTSKPWIEILFARQNDGLYIIPAVFRTLRSAFCRAHQKRDRHAQFLPINARRDHSRMLG